VPRRDIDRLHDEIEELFSDLWQVPRFLGQRRAFRPNVDSYLTEDPHELTVIAELPGVDPASVQVVVEEGALVISGERKRPKADARVYQQMEIEYGPFQRRIPLDEPVDTSTATARYEQGLLTVELPIAAKAPTRERVSIAVGGRLE
jgi:HSP20 family protein